MTHFHPNPTLGQIGDIVFPPVAPVLEDVTQLTSRKTVVNSCRITTSIGRTRQPLVSIADGFPDRFPRKSKNSPFFATTRDEGELDYILPRGKVGNGASRAVASAEAEWPLWARLGDLRQVVLQRARCADSGRSRDRKRTGKIDPGCVKTRTTGGSL